MAFKQERLEKIIVRELSTFLLMEAKDERLKYVTITNCHLTGDLSLATVYYTVYGTDEQKTATASVLQEAKGMLRGHLGKALQVKKIPDLKFKYDESMEYGDRIDKILKDLNL